MRSCSNILVLAYNRKLDERNKGAGVGGCYKLVFRGSVVVLWSCGDVVPRYSGGYKRRIRWANKLQVIFISLHLTFMFSFSFEKCGVLTPALRGASSEIRTSLFLPWHLLSTG